MSGGGSIERRDALALLDRLIREIAADLAELRRRGAAPAELEAEFADIVQEIGEAAR